MAKKPPATKSEVNKSKAIRDYLKANRKAMPKDVAAALKEKGIEVSPQAVSTVKFTMKKKRRGKRPAGGRKSASGNGQMVSVRALLDAKKLVDKIGGLEKAKSALDALSKLS